MCFSNIQGLDTDESCISDSSLWPKQKTWLDSPFATGYWTEQHEAFYRKRRAEIQSGRGDLKTARQWKRLLKQGSTDAKRFQTAMQDMARAQLL